MTTRAPSAALTASLIVNLFAVGGLVGGGVMLLRDARVPAATTHGRPIFKVASELSPADQARFHDAMRQVVNEGLPLQRSARADRRVAADLFERADFDADAADAALKRAREADFAYRVSLEEAVVRFARTLPASERRLFARGLGRSGPLHRAAADPGPVSASVSGPVSAPAAHGR